MESLAPLTWLIPLPPLLSFFLIVLFAHRSKALSHMIAIGMMAISWVLSWKVFFDTVGNHLFGEEVVHSAFDWLPFGAEATGQKALQMGVMVDPLTAIMLFFVPLACLLIFLYSVGYHNFNKPRDAHDKPGWPAHNGVEPLYSRFFAFLSLFACGMLTLVVADNLLLMFVGWEIMGLCSYLLIGFWFAREYEDPFQITPRKASVKAFMTTRIGDVFMLLGIAYLYFATGTLSFREIMFAHDGEILHHLASEHSPIAWFTQAELVGVLLVIGTIGKSAQFPLHVWLPDAMEGPTPVSAMIHAATMVSAGIYAIIRVFPILSAAPVAHGAEGEVAHTLVLTAPMWLMAIAGSITAIMGATIAIAQNDVKKVLAYSTISQLGFMMAVLGIGGYVAAAFHLMTHAFFKALLFLGSGSIIHGMEHGMHHSHEHIDPQDMRYMGGLSSKMPITFWTFVIGGAALAGFPFITAGFWSKDEILLDTFSHAPIIFGILALSALLTAFYTTRQIVMTFLGSPRTESAKHAHESHWTMTVPLMVLSFFAITAGWSNIPEDFPIFGGLAHSLHIDSWFKHLVVRTLAEAPESPEFTPIPLMTSIIVGLGGIALGYFLYRNAYQKADDRDPMERLLGPLYNLLRNKYYIDTGKTKEAPGKYVDNLYQTLFVNPVVWLSENFTAAVLDRQLIDGLLHFVAGLGPRIGLLFRDYFDTPIINKLIGDGTATVVQRVGREGRVIQTGRLQEYLLAVLAAVVFFAAVLIFSPKGP